MKRKAASFPRLLRIAGRILLWTLVSGLGLIVIAAVGLYCLCLFQGEHVASLLEQRLSAATDIVWRIRGPIRPAFLPRPGLTVEAVDLAAATGETPVPLFSLKKMTMEMHLPLLLRGTLWPGRVELDSPSFTFRRGSQEGAAGTGEGETPASPAGKSGGQLLSATANPDGFLVTPGALRALREKEPPLVLVHNGTLTYRGSRDEVLVELTAVTAELDPEEQNPSLVFSAQLAAPEAALTVSLTGALSSGSGDILAEGQVRGQALLAVPGGSRPVMGEFSTSALWKEKETALLLPDLALSAEGDSLTAELRVDIPSRVCTGKVVIGHLSLPRWFQFGRNLPPGLQALLSEVRGSFDLFLTPTSAEARSLTGKAGELSVEGYVGAVDFAKPVIKVDVTTPGANLDPVFPFLAAVGTTILEAEEETFPFPPLAPYPGLDDTGIPDVGYDVRVYASSVLAHRISGGPLELFVLPAGDDARVTFTVGDFLGGHVAGRLDIGDRRVAMRYDVRGAQLAPLPENSGSSVRFAGALTGNADITIRVMEDGSWADQWQFTSEAAVKNLRITNHGDMPWHIASGDARATGKGVIHAAVRNGIRLEGQWNATARNVAPSWNPKGNDTLALTLDGALAWPPQKPQEILPSSARPVMQRRGLNRISGDLGASGTLFVPLGKRLVPVRGTLRAQLDWLIDKGLITLRSAGLDGLGSYLSGDLSVDTSGRGFTLAFPANFKLAPRVVLEAWKMLPDGGIRIPELLTGKARIQADPATLTFGDLNVQADGAPIQGEVSCALPRKDARGEEPGLWKLRLVSQRLDLDRYFPPEAPQGAPAPEAGKEKSPFPSRKPWRLDALDGINLDGKITLRQSRLRDLALTESDLTLVLQRNKFSIASSTADFYGGTVVTHAQGTLVPERSQVILGNAHMEFRGVDLGKALYDASKDNSYGGKVDMAAEFSGIMAFDADLPSALSGNWSVTIQDGIYPAFLGSETAGLRNTFSRAAVSGVLEKGVLRWKNFTLGGALVDMVGEGWADIGKKMLDFTLNVTVARVPTVPVRFSGPFAAPSMTVRGAHAVVYTAQAAGSTIFSLLRGVLELPGRALRGVGNLFAPDDPKKDEEGKR